MAETLQRLERDHFPKPPGRVLELGCGNGLSSSQWMARRGYEVHGIDISQAAIAWAEEAFTENGLAGSFRQGSVCAMPFFAGNSFDIVIDGSCLHCLIGGDRTDAFRKSAGSFGRKASSSSAACAAFRNPMMPGPASIRTAVIY